MDRNLNLGELVPVLAALHPVLILHMVAAKTLPRGGSTERPHPPLNMQVLKTMGAMVVLATVGPAFALSTYPQISYAQTHRRDDRRDTRRGARCPPSRPARPVTRSLAPSADG